MFCSVLATTIVVLLLGLIAGNSSAQTHLRASYGSLAVSQVVLPLGVRAGSFRKTASSSNRSILGGDRFQL